MAIKNVVGVCPSDCVIWLLGAWVKLRWWLHCTQKLTGSHHGLVHVVKTKKN